MLTRKNTSPFIIGDIYSSSEEDGTRAIIVDRTILLEINL
jgi:hypothetical protein